MSIDKEIVKHIAYLARIELDEEEIEYYSFQLTKILNYIGKINQLNLEDIPLSFNPHLQTNVYQEDKIQKFQNREGLIKIAPDAKGNFIKIPKVID